MGMPSSVIKNKEKLRLMSDLEFVELYGDSDIATLKSMAWRHGYGKDSLFYVSKMLRGSVIRWENNSYLATK